MLSWSITRTINRNKIHGWTDIDRLGHKESWLADYSSLSLTTFSLDLGKGDF